MKQSYLFSWMLERLKVRNHAVVPLLVFCAGVMVSICSKEEEGTQQDMSGFHLGSFTTS